jgi:hypothetical protein
MARQRSLLFPAVTNLTTPKPSDIFNAIKDLADEEVSGQSKAVSGTSRASIIEPPIRLSTVCP